MVTDAMEDSNYTGMFSGNNFVGFKYSVTANGATNAWSSSSAGGSAGYITNAYYNQTLEATKWLSTKMQWYITNAGATVTGVSGAKTSGQTQVIIRVSEFGFRKLVMKQHKLRVLP